MSISQRLIRAATATGTHHYLALDALERMQGAAAARWTDLFYKHARVYLEGAKAPDNEFKDFQNHVLHPRDGYWGGAPDKAVTWYRNLVDALAKSDWATAAWCAGVLSHYCLDPLQPFHTGQTEAENNIHRAAEWSISRSYAALAQLGETHFGDIRIALPDQPNWLALMLCAGADKANTHYEKLIAHYDINRGVVDPPAGLDVVAQRVVAEMIAYGTRMFAVILEQAIAEAKAVPPEVSLAAETLRAVMSMPLSRWRKRQLDAGERALVEAMYDELKVSGTVRNNLPEDDRVIRDAHAREVLAKRTVPEAAQVFPFKPRAEAVTRIERQRLDAARSTGRRGPGDVVVLAEPPRPAPKRTEAPRPRIRQDLLRQLSTDADEAVAAVAAARGNDAVGEQPNAGRIAAASATEVPIPAQPAPPIVAVAMARSEPGLRVVSGGAASSVPSVGMPRSIYLTTEHDVVDAPSIGPKMAERLNAVGIDTIADLLKAHPIALASRLDAKGVSEATIGEWQDQTRLVCTVPGLRGTHAQLLVGAGYRTAEAVAAAEVEKFCADILSFALTPAGQRMLRDGRPPDIERIKGWLASARAVKAA